MKRLQGKKLALPSRVVRGTLQAVKQNDSTFWLYTEKDLSIYTELYASRIDIIDLPFLDVYEVKAQNIKGITVGYVIDTNARKITSAFNYLCALSPSVDAMSLKDLRETNSLLQLRYKVRGIFLYSLGVYGSVVTLGHNESIKEKLEF